MPKFPTGGQAGSPERGADNAPEPGGGRGTQANGKHVTERKKQYLVAPRQQPMGAIGPLAMGMQPLGLQAVEQALRAIPDIEVVRTITPKSTIGVLGGGMGEPEGLLVARMTDDKAGALRQQGQGRLLVERDQHLHLFDPALPRPNRVASLIPYDGPSLEVTVVVRGKDGAPLPDAEVSLFGGLMPSIAVTDAGGLATLKVYGNSPHAISGLYVKPRADYWSFYQRDPDLSTGQPNLVALRALSDWPALPGFPGRSAVGWGERAMRLDQLPPSFRGQGVKVAVIDSGAATSHANLSRIRSGWDIIHNNPTTWTEDQLGHGSHCTGIIAGADPSFGIRGFVPDAEIHVCKLFPGGQISELIEALEYCIEHQIDVVNLSLGAMAPSEALEQQIVRAKRAGVAIIAAVGNSGGPVQYPAASPQVLSVAAIGKLDEFPRDSYHTETISPDVDAQGFFTAKFSCFGARVDVCAPGVAIVSAVPPNNFAAWDGTSMAAPHITGLAALMLAHHPEFQAQARVRSAERVERLFQLIRLSGRRLTLADPTRIGYGMPDALVALGLAVAPGQAAFQSMLAQLLAGAPRATSMGEAAYAGAPLGQRPLGPADLMSFGFAMGGMRPQGW
ncbi:S8 family serine peptidase [Massilia horti]|uniref:Subtilisin n=1 Tax=Massilia horti TaxID=2562153 RepID=A0A4Y9SWV6_9BURK|nr:S8 family serine peptidase [Massilia horti]TFW30912.1 subtilisin [Massilia horti]